MSPEVRETSPPFHISPFPVQVGEMCPATFTALYKQRLRWAMGWEQVSVV